jgi:tripartite-type tricarboxylate transporter receptor subunit TctC
VGPKIPGAPKEQKTNNREHRRMPTRRILLAIAPGLSAPALLHAAAATAQEPFPNRSITLVNPYPPGGATDFGARLVATRMEPELRQPIIVESRPGAGTAVANAYVAGLQPDGYALLMGTTSLAVLPHLQPASQPRDPRVALDPIGTATRSSYVLHIHPDLPVRSATELITYAKANPGKLSWGSSGVGAINHMTLELFRARAKVEVVHVPYRGGAAALLDLHAGRIQAMFAAVQEAGSSVRDGKTRGLAVTSITRVAALPELAPLADTLPGFETVFWQGLFGPAGLPTHVTARLGAALRAATEDAMVRRRMAEQGVDAWPGDAALLRRTLAAEMVAWGGLIRESNIRAE